MYICKDIYIYIYINICNINISTPSTSPQHTLKTQKSQSGAVFVVCAICASVKQVHHESSFEMKAMNVDQRWRVIRSLKLTAGPRKLVVGRLHKISMWLSCEYCIKRATGQSCGIGIQQEHLFILYSSVDGHKRDWSKMSIGCKHKAFRTIQTRGNQKPELLFFNNQATESWYVFGSHLNSSQILGATFFGLDMVRPMIQCPRCPSLHLVPDVLGDLHHLGRNKNRSSPCQRTKKTFRNCGSKLSCLEKYGRWWSRSFRPTWGCLKTQNKVTPPQTPKSFFCWWALNI